MLPYAIYALWSAHGRVMIADILKMAQTAPRSADQLTDAEWLAGSFCFRTVLQMERKLAYGLRPRDREATTEHWKTAFANEDARTTGTSSPPFAA